MKKTTLAALFLGGFLLVASSGCQSSRNATYATSPVVTGAPIASAPTDATYLSIPEGSTNRTSSYSSGGSCPSCH